MCSGERDRREQVNKPSGDGQTVKGTMQEKTQGNETEVGWGVGSGETCRVEQVAKFYSKSRPL